MAYTVASIMERLSALSNEKRMEINRRGGVTGEQFGVPMGPLRALAKEIKRDHALGMELWRTGNFDAMVLGAMLMDPKVLTEADFEASLASAYVPVLVDELTLRPLCESPLAASFCLSWRNSPEDLKGRAGWNLAVDRVQRHVCPPDELGTLFGEVEAGLQTAPANKQWAMNYCLCMIGIHNDAWTERCLALGERLGVYRDLKVPKGCTSAYAPEWIRVGRAKKGG